MWTMIALSHVTQHNIESLYPMSKGLKDPAALSFYTMLSPRQPGRKERVMSPRPPTPSVQMLQMPRLSWTLWNFHLKQRRKRRPTKATRKKGKSQESMSSPIPWLKSILIGFRMCSANKKTKNQCRSR